MTLRTKYSLHVLGAMREGFAPLTLRQFVSIVSSIKFKE